VSEIETQLRKLGTSELSHEIYLLGICESEVSLPVLVQFSDDPKISHHVRHKGMSIGYIANEAIDKINGGLNK